MNKKRLNQMILPPELNGTQKIKNWALRYSKFDCDKDEWILEKIQTSLASNGHLDLTDLKSLGVWKNGSERLSKCFAKNEPQKIRRQTHEAYQHQCIRPLRELYGFRTGFPMVSSFMHFAFPMEFPVIDRRALATLGVDDNTTMSRHIWILYCDKCRVWTDRFHVSYRELDRALWQFNLEKEFWDRVRLLGNPRT